MNRTCNQQKFLPQEQTNNQTRRYMASYLSVLYVKAKLEEARSYLKQHTTVIASSVLCHMHYQPYDLSFTLRS